MRRSLLLIFGALLPGVSVLAPGCSCAGDPPPTVDAGSDAPAVDAWTAPDAWSFQIAPHAPGSVVPDQGGTRLTHPQLVVITYADDPNRATLEADAAWVATSGWLTTVGAEYGIGDGSVLANVRRTDAAPVSTTTAEIQAMLEAGVNDHSLPRAADGTLHDVLYLIYFPSTTTITDPDLGQSCMSYGGYHFEGRDAGGVPFAYAVIPACTAFNPSLTDLEFEEEAVSHEVIEAATDALPTSDPAYAFPQRGPDYSPWLYVGPELADLCALRVGPNAAYREGGFVATRMWSNAIAAAGNADPCIPDSGVPFRSISITPDTIQFITAGESITFAIDAWTTAPVPDYQLYAAVSGGTFMPDAVLDRTVVNNGAHATLTVTAPAGSPSGAYALVYVEVVTRTTEYDGIPVVVVVP